MAAIVGIVEKCGVGERNIAIALLTLLTARLPKRTRYTLPWLVQATPHKLVISHRTLPRQMKWPPSSDPGYPPSSPIQQMVGICLQRGTVAKLQEPTGERAAAMTFHVSEVLTEEQRKFHLQHLDEKCLLRLLTKHDERARESMERRQHTRERVDLSLGQLRYGLCAYT